MASKRCTKCGAEKLLEEFYRLPAGQYGRQSHCKACADARQKQRHLENPSARVNTRLKSKYGLTLVDYDRMLAQQNGRCAICGTETPGGPGGRFAVDHDHVTGQVRALLCARCNPVLGMMDEDPERLEAAARYLRAFKRG